MYYLQVSNMSHRCADALLDHLEKNPVWKLHAFLHACVLADMGHVVTILGLNIEDYKKKSS